MRQTEKIKRSKQKKKTSKLHSVIQNAIVDVVETLCYAVIFDLMVSYFIDYV